MASFNLRSTLDLVTSIILIAASSTLIYRNWFDTQPSARAELKLPSEPVSIEGVPIRGSKDAEAVMIVYSDFQCPFCARFARDVLPDIERRYVATGRVALAFRHLPLPIHPHAIQAAVGAECAGQQGQFWEMHDILFAQDRLDDEILRALPDSIDLDREKYDQCLKDQGAGAKVEASADQAKGFGIRGTPAFFFGKRLGNGRVHVTQALSGARPIADFVEALNATLSAEPTGWWSRIRLSR